MIRMALLLTAATTAFAVVDAEQAAPTSADNTPFYQGITDEASLTRVVEWRLARAEQLLDRLVAAKGKRTVENTLRLYDDIQTEILNADGLNENAQMLHPDAKVIATAERLRQSRSAGRASWTKLGMAAFLAVMSSDLAAQTGQGAAQIQPIPRSILDLQRTYDNARERREPVTHLLADAFVEIQADGRVLTRAQAIEKYTRFDDVSTGSVIERRTASYGDVAIIAGRTGEEGTPFSARRLYVWVDEGGSWRLLVFQKTFMRSRTARFTPLSAEWPAEYRDAQAGVAEEQTFAARDPALLRGLLADDSVLVDGYGDQWTGRTWLAQLNETNDTPPNVRNVSLLYQGETAVVIGEEVSPSTELASRFTRVWTRSPQGMQLRVSQATLAAAEVFGPER